MIRQASTVLAGAFLIAWLSGCAGHSGPASAESTSPAALAASDQGGAKPVSTPAPATVAVEGRAVWVARGQYQTPDDVRAVMKNCAEHGFNQVIFQVRGNATVYSRSKIEPWAWELSGGGPENLGKDPGWDPLAVAVEEAHKLGLELHAWVNVYPGWRGGDWPPAGTTQLWNQHPEWFMKAKDGSQMLPYYVRDGRKTVWYSFINPAHPDVNPYLVKVFSEIVREYDVDGIHMDYVRYPHDFREWDFSYDEVSLARFKADTGKTPDEDRAAWNRWRGDRVTELVRALHKELKAIRRGIAITAAVAGDYEHGKDNMQFGREWVAEGLLDAVFLMNYQTNDDNYRKNIRDCVAESRGTPVYSGMGPFRFARDADAGDHFRRQMQIARDEGAAGVCLFSYETLFGGRQNTNDFAKILKEEFYAQRALSPMRAARTR